jgi:tRNA-binding EMAP/Myf-like protein
LKEDDMTKKANHQVNIVRIAEVKEHTNADSLEIIPVGEYQVVSRKGQFNVGDLGVYIQPDSVVPQTEPFRFIWEPFIELDGTVSEKRRRITVRKFRKEWSEGLLLPVTDFDELVDSTLTRHFVENDFPEGTDVSDLLGITHYDPDTESTKGENSNAPKLRKKYPRTFTGWLKFFKRKLYGLFRSGPLDGKSDNISLGIPTYDVDALKNYPHTFQDGEQVIVTEKIHGSNARYIFLDGTMYAGSRNLWKSESSSCIFRRNLKENPWIEEWCRAHEGYVLWGEIGPSQKGFDYGTKAGKLFFFVFDVRTPDGKWLDREHDEAGLLAQLMDHSVPILYQGPYNLEEIKKHVDGKSNVPGAKHIREGVVIKTATEGHARGIGRKQMKIVSNAYLEKETK